jgi:7-cyano-7-deazaguanine synthase in queuosine biosynthesis
MKVLIMFSGGVESTALIQHALKHDHQFELLHVIHNNSSQNEMTSASMMGYPVFDLKLIKDSFDETHQGSHRDISLWLAGAMIAVGRDDYDQVWFGAHSRDSGLVRINLMVRLFADMMKILDRKAILSAPLQTFSKRDQHSMLTSHQKSCIVTCKNGKYDAQCGQCDKCKEFQRYVG